MPGHDRPRHHPTCRSARKACASPRHIPTPTPVVAARIDPARAPRGMFLSAATLSNSVRTARCNGETHLNAAGGAYQARPSRPGDRDVRQSPALRAGRVYGAKHLLLLDQSQLCIDGRHAVHRSRQLERPAPPRGDGLQCLGDHDGHGGRHDPVGSRPGTCQTPGPRSSTPRASSRSRQRQARPRERKGSSRTGTTGDDGAATRSAMPCASGRGRHVGPRSHG